MILFSFSFSRLKTLHRRLDSEYLAGLPVSLFSHYSAKERQVRHDTKIETETYSF